ncbi:thioredoxin domain-containing protein, partial [Candidatus Pacearchaeota archaeon]|nr:thioredoxin domain-containing protein [Candidatus Pacearchaeota archaeon]
MEENQESTGTVTIKKSDLWKYSTFILVVVVIIGMFVMFNGNNNTTVTGNTAGTQEPTTAKATVDDDAVLGNKDAPVTIIEFSDYQCPFCRKFWTETFSQIKTQYIDTGKVK